MRGAVWAAAARVAAQEEEVQVRDLEGRAAARVEVVRVVARAAVTVVEAMAVAMEVGMEEGRAAAEKAAGSEAAAMEAVVEEVKAVEAKAEVVKAVGSEVAMAVVVRSEVEVGVMAAAERAAETVGGCGPSGRAACVAPHHRYNNLARRAAAVLARRR